MAKSEYKFTLSSEEMIQMLRGDAGGVEGAAGIYKRVPLVYRALRLRANALATVPVHLYQGDGEEPIDWPFITTAYDLMWNVQASLLARGCAYILPNNGKLTGKPRDFQVLNPFCVSTNYIGGQFTFTYSPTNGPVKTYTQDELIWIWEYNPADYTQPGPGAAQVAVNDARLLYYTSRFPGVFFENGGMPITLVSIKTTLDSEVKKIIDWFKAKTTGIAQAFGILGVKADSLTATTLTPPMKDMSFPDLTKQARQAIADAFELPITMLEDAANFATAAQHDQTFWETSVKPTGLRIEQALNKFLDKFGYRVQIAFDELSAFQSDEHERAGSLGQLTTAGIPLKLAMEILGYDLSDEQWAMLEAETAQPAAIEPMPSLDGQADTMPDMQPMDEPTAEDTANALATWKRKAIASVKRGQPADVEFITRAVSERMQTALHYELQVCKTVDDVKAAFDAIKPTLETVDKLTPLMARALAILEDAHAA